MNQKDRSRLYIAGGASVAVNLFVWLAVSQGFAQSSPALDLPPAEISRVTQTGDGQVIPKVIGKGTGVATEEIAGVPMALPAAEELKKQLANLEDVPAIQKPNSQSSSSEEQQTRREVERTMRDFGYRSRTYDQSGNRGSSQGSGYAQDYMEPDVEITTSGSYQAPQQSAPQAQAASGAPVSFGPNSAAIPISFADAYLPDHLKRARHSNSVQVRFEVGADGKAQVYLESTTGVKEIDDLVVTSLKLWRWRPAHKDGQPYASTVKTVYNFPT